MKYIQDTPKLVKIFGILASHKMEIKYYYQAGLAPRILAFTSPMERARLLFTLSNADRTSTGSGNSGLIKSSAVFWNGLQDKINECSQMQPELAHNYFLHFLCDDIPGMDQKTANLYLKYLAMFQVEFNLNMLNWTSWEQFLHVPLDIWVLRLMSTKYLNICNQLYENDFKQTKTNKKTGRKVDDYPSPLFHSDRYVDLQNDLSEFADTQNENAIILDTLWFIGSKYCAHHPLLSERCWVREYCSNNTSINWNKVDMKTKPQIKNDRKEYNRNVTKFSREVANRFKNEFPNQGSVTDFIQTKQGQAWFHKIYNELSK